MANVQVRGCCCGVPVGCGTLLLLAGCLLLWKLIHPAIFGDVGATALLSLLAVGGVGLVLSARMGRRDVTPGPEGPFDLPPLP